MHLLVSKEMSHEPQRYPETWSKGGQVVRYKVDFPWNLRNLTSTEQSLNPSQQVYLTLEIHEMRLIFALLSITSLAIALPKRDTQCDRLGSVKFCEGGNEETVTCCPSGQFFLCEPDGTLSSGTCDEGTSCLDPNLNEPFATNGQAACQ
jgi:hypothetical protein